MPWKIVNLGGQYSYICVLCYQFILKSIVFTLYEHEYINLLTFRGPRTVAENRNSSDQHLNIQVKCTFAIYRLSLWKDCTADPFYYSLFMSELLDHNIKRVNLFQHTMGKYKI